MSRRDSPQPISRYVSLTMLYRRRREELLDRYGRDGLRRQHATDGSLTYLIAQFVQNVWIESYDPTIEDSYRKQIEVDVSSRGIDVIIPPAYDILFAGSTMHSRDVRLSSELSRSYFILLITVQSGHSRNRAIQYVLTSQLR